MALIRCGGGVVAAVLFLGCGGPPPDSPTVDQVAGISLGGHSSKVVGPAGADAPTSLPLPLPQPANLEHSAPQENMTESPLAGQSEAACFAVVDCRYQAGSTTVEPASAEYNSAATYGSHQTGPQVVPRLAGAFATDDPPDVVTPVAGAVIDEAEQIQAHDIWLDQLLQEVE